MSVLSDEQKWQLWDEVSHPSACLDAIILAYGNAVADAAVQAAREGQEPFGWYFMDDPKVFTLPGSGFHVGALPPKQSINRVPLYTTPPAATVVPELEEIQKLLAAVKYIIGIAERGEGRRMRDDESAEQFVLGYVKKLEAAYRDTRAEEVSDVKADAVRYKMAFEMATAGGREVYYEGWGGRMRRGYLGPEEARTATLEAVNKQLLVQSIEEKGNERSE